VKDATKAPINHEKDSKNIKLEFQIVEAEKIKPKITE
jgi:hypothetical protein